MARTEGGDGERVHDAVKNELGAGVMTAGIWGQTGLAAVGGDHPQRTDDAKSLALPTDLLRARPKRLYFLIFNTTGASAECASARPATGNPGGTDCHLEDGTARLAASYQR